MCCEKIVAKQEHSDFYSVTDFLFVSFAIDFSCGTVK